ncbi:hypothetical protein Lpp124_03193, partial [Lacticaseibacillus paracasei subsp. paracasei CNCM I-4649]
SRKLEVVWILKMELIAASKMNFGKHPMSRHFNKKIQKLSYTFVDQPHV